jgi:putative endonuclease
MIHRVSKFKAERQARYRRGLASEYLAAALLMAKGYRILARRYQASAGEIDLIACRGRRLVFVEVKQRLTLQDCEASVTSNQRARVRRAADQWLAHKPNYRTHDITFDVIFLTPRRWPRHLMNAL